jgi:DNA-binding NarL/FixJ family response regulator
MANLYNRFWPDASSASTGSDLEERGEQNTTVEIVMDTETFVRNPILLIVHDDQCEAIVRAVFCEMGLLEALRVLSDSESALIQLQSSQRNRPRLILLDLEMPQTKAFHFLESIKADATLRMIPVVVLASSDSDEDVIACYSLGAAGYLVKSADSSSFREKIMAACGYWTLSRVPLA